jgi:Zn-dependent peptidase ImmA (M78 family)/transcriptional regulator with XRE-family HTH domain
MAIHERLKFARDAAALSGAQVRERTGIGESSLSEFENGKREPSVSQLSKLAATYSRGVGFFLEESPLRDPSVLWKLRPSTNAKETEVAFLQLCSQYQNLEMWCGEHGQFRLTPAGGDAATYGDADAEELAKLVLRELPLGDWPGQSLLAVLEEVAGVKIFHLDFEPAGTAASTSSEHYGAAILLNAKNPRWQRNEDLAHELFHLLTWNIFHPNSDAALIPREREEALADLFAANLLLPTGPFRSAINLRVREGKLSLDSMLDVAREFDVTIDLVVCRMHAIYGRLPEDDERVQTHLLHAREYSQRYDRRHDGPTPDEYPERYRALAIKSLRQGEASLGKIAKYLKISRQDAQQFEQGVLDGEEVQVAVA